MNTQKTTMVALCLVLAGILGYAVAKKGASPDSQAMTIHTYSVPSGRAEEMKNVLNRMFQATNNDGGAQVFGNNVLVVKGTPGYQAGIARLVEQAGEQKNADVHMIHIDYWLVRGEDSSPKEANTRAIPALEAVLETIGKAQGPKKFTLLEHLGYSSLDRREVRIKGAMAEVKSISKVVDGQIELMLETKARAGLGELKTDTQIKPGEYVILGENAMQPHADEIAAGKASVEDERRSREVYHVIRAEVLP